MGNKLSCSCAPLMRKAYRYEDSPWQTSRRRDGHLLSSFRLWAEVFHVSASGAGTVKWQQVSEDLVPVNITCIQDSPECVFHITAYNSQVDKILDVRLVQPGTRIGQASECFVYWKDPMTNDTWGLNFTSPIDAKQFRECCSPSFKFSRKASSSYSLKLDPPGKGKIKAKRKPLSTPASPSRVRSEPQCTCMSAEQYARLRTDPRVRGSSTLPRSVGSRITDVDVGGQQQKAMANATSSTSLYDNVAGSGGIGTQSMNAVGGQDTLGRQVKSQDPNITATNTGVNTGTPSVMVSGVATGTNDLCSQNHVGSQVGPDDGLIGGQQDMDVSKNEGTQVGGPLHQNVGTSTKSTGTRTKDYVDEMTRDARAHDMHQHNIINNNTRRKTKSTEDMNVDTSTLKHMLKPMPSTESPVTSPEMGRRRYNYYNANVTNTLGPQHMHQHGGGMGGLGVGGMGMLPGGPGGGGGMHHIMNNNNTMGRVSNQSSRFSGSRSSHEIGRGYPQRNLYLELERERSCIEGSPPSDNVMFDNQCYATTPSSSNGNSDQDQSYGQRNASGGVGGGGRHQHHHQAPNVTPTPGSPTSRLLLEYEMHLRNTLAKGMDAESYSLHTFEALLSQSMENLELAESLPGSTQRSPYPMRRPSAKSSTLPLPPHRPLSMLRDKERDRERDGYYSDRNELIRERERERERDRGYLSDHNTSFSTSRCASCIGESARAQWFRHSDGWRSGSSTIGSGSGQGLMSQQTTGSGHKRSPWDSLPSLRQDSSLNDSGYKSARADSLEQRAEFIRQDSLRSDYLSDRDSRYGIVQQASIDSTDSRMCYLTSSEPLILAASHNSESDNNNSVSGSGSDKKSFSLHCCCVIVDITPVSQAARLTSATTASGRDVTAGSGSGGGGGVLGDGVSQLASSLFRFGSKKRGVCICNAQCRMQALEQQTAQLGQLDPALRTHHGSLDRLLQQQEKQSQQQRPSASAVHSIGGVVDGGGSGVLLGSADSDGDGDDEKEPELPPLPPSRIKSQTQVTRHIKEQFDRGVEVEKFYHQINGDIFEITRRVRARDEDTIEQKVIKRKGSVRLPPEPPPRQASVAASAAHTQMYHGHGHSHPHSHPHVHRHTADGDGKPQLPPRRQKSAEEVPVSKSTTRPPNELEWFDRKAKQRHSARSAESGAVREETIEWLERQRGPVRTSSGPSEITVMKDEVPDWLLEHLPRKRSMADRPSESKTSTTSYAKALKEELAELLKKPLSRQSSGPPGEFSILKTDIVEWLTKLQTSSRSSAREEAPPPQTRRAHHRRNGSGDTQRSHSQEDATITQQAARKRHSLGHSDRSEEEMLDWIAYPLNRLQSLGKPLQQQPQMQTIERRQPFAEHHHKPAAPPPQTQLQIQHQQPICAERERRSHERTRERKLRHSASEVVTALTTSAAAQSQLERLYAKPHKERYQYVPKDTKDMIMLPPKESSKITTAVTSASVRESKRERSRRHQTQRSATVSDMSGHHNGGLKRKSSSAERAPRSPSPCNDPACRLLPICADPHCRFPECQTIDRSAVISMTTSTSTMNLARHQQVARAQMHTVPANITSDDTPTPPPPPPPTSQQQQFQPQRRLVICHECRSCAPLLTCQNRKCFNAAKCNSLPRSAADFNRLRTTLVQPPTTLDDIEPAPETPSPQMPRHPGMQYRSNSQPNTLQRGDSAAGLWQQDGVDGALVGSGHSMVTGMTTVIQSSQLPLPPSSLHIASATNGRHFYNGRNGNGMSHLNGTNGKLMKSASAASLNSRRRRHKTVHFGENLLREVCQNRKLIKTEQVPSGSAPMKANIQMLYNFVEGVLSAWVDDDEEQVRSGAESEPEQGTMALKPIYRCNRLRYQCIKRIVEEAAELHGTLKLGNSRYRHRHWRSTAKQCNEMFLRKISDDDRMSLTTAVSDEDDGESVMASPYKAKATGTAASSFNCTGAVRKAGFLSVKKWLLRKKHQIELARKRGWKGYWVCLKGTTLLFYPCDSREGRSVEAAPKHLIIVDGAIMQPIPEHPKRDYIFCLSTAFGDAYLFQAPCQVELENWVNSIHSACAAAFARHRGKTGTLHLLQEEIFRLEKAIESDHKLKHMAELQQSVVTDQDTRHQIQTQILQWEENLERLHCEQFRLRCYMASLQSGELPNPKSLLTHVSRPTKNTLNKLGVFTVSSFHAFICARSPSLLNNLLAGRGATKRRPPMLSRSNSGSSRRSMQMNSRDEPEKTFKVAMPDNAYATVYLRDAMSVEEFLASACARRNLNPMEHFVRVKKRRDMEDHNYFVPHRNDLIENYLHNHEFVEVCMKILYQVELHRTTLEQMWGFSVEAELIENAERQDELCCYVSRVEDKSVAMQNGIIKGDEIMVINAAIVSDLDMMYLESVLQEEQSLCMMMRSSRTEPPDLVGIMRVTDDMIDSLVCPPPPSDPPIMSEEMISGLIVPAPGWNGTGKDLYSPEAESSPAPSSVEQTPAQMVAAATKPTSRTSSFEIENLLKTAEQETRKSSPTGSVTSSVSNAALTPSRQLTDAEKLRKVILELVDTERTYVKHLNNLLENYLEPMKRETFLSNAEINALFGNIHEIVTFQRQFLQNLEEALELEPDFHKFDHSSQFRNVLFAIGSAFLYYVNHFKLYSSFCASHSKAQKVLHPNEGNHALQEFLAARNPKQQHSSTLESYLIKPIQRILKYPLLLQQLRNLTDARADEHLHLCEALKGMEKVAEHINEMQRIHEEYGAIFDHLFRQHQKSCKQPIDLSPGDLLYYGGVEWLNISDFLGKIKKGLELHAMCFVFKSAVVFLCKERLRQKKKLMGVSSKNAPNEVEIIRYQVLIPVTEVQVRASSAKDMDSHFLWELIHLRSQLQRRSEKVYVLSNSTADFRNAFLKTIRQIIRESVRNMSIPMKGFGSSGSVSGISSQGGGSGSSQTLERPKQQITIIQGSQTLGKPKKKSGSQRHSAGNIDYDNLSGSQEAEDVPILHQHHQQQQQLQPSGFRGRSKTVGDATDPLQQQLHQHQKHMQHHQQQQQQHMHHHHQQQQVHHQSDIERMDPGTKSEGEEDSQQGTIKAKATLGRTPNHLTLSTTSTLSVGSTGSQARLIQSSHPPSSYQPVLMKDLGKTNSITYELSSSPQAEIMDAPATVNSLSVAMEATDQMMFMIEEMGVEMREMDEEEGVETAEMDYILESELQTASVDAAYNLNLGISGSSSSSRVIRGGSDLANNTRISGSGNGNNLHYVHTPKRLSPRQSPKADIEVIEIFANELSQLTAAQQVSVVHHSAKESSKYKSSSRQTSVSSNGSGNGNSNNEVSVSASTHVVDKHLSDLEHEQLTDTTYDIAAYMANLKEQTLESQELQMDVQDQQQNDSSLSPEPQTVVENTQQTVVAEIESPPRPATESDSSGITTGTSEKSEDESEYAASLSAHVIIDKKVDKVFKSKTTEKAQKSSSGSSSSIASAGAKPKITKSPRQSIYISPDRSKSQGSSPVRIIKIKSPRTSVSEQGKRLNVSSSRDSSADRLSGGRRTPSPRRSSDGSGILKRPTSPATGILKPPPSPSKSRSPDRSCLKKLTPAHDCSIESLSPHISPRDSIEHLSPDRAGTSLCQRHSPRSSFDSRSSEPNLDIPRSSLKSPRGSFESRSPERCSRKRSQSAHGSFETGQRAAALATAEAYYQYYPIYDNQTCSDHYISAATTTNLPRDVGTNTPTTTTIGTSTRRISKSLERSTSRESTTSSSYRYGVSPERIYTINTTGMDLGPLRSQSAENTFVPYSYDPHTGEHYEIQQQDFAAPAAPPAAFMYAHEAQCPHDRISAYQLSSSAPEYTTCIDCLYQKRPS